MAQPGVYTEKYIPVFSDTLDVLNRIQQIDHTYFILLNRITGKFEVHSCAQANGSFCLELPYPCLDARAVSFVQRYRSARAKEVLEEMERENSLLQERRINAMKDTVEEAVEAFGGRKR
jgi:hypothetical protein